VFVLVVAIGLAIGWIVGRGSVEVAEVGAPAPDFTVELIDGGTFTLSDSLGQPAVINLWASWCGPCREEIPDISAFATAQPGVTVVGVAVRDAENDARRFASTIGASYPLALGTPEFEESYPSLGLPATYIVDGNGTVIEIYNGIVDEQILTDALG
jgi:cytochrome c biogenesis protein CcmG/thiol:disulfide interchange protein DsbE